MEKCYLYCGRVPVPVERADGSSVVAQPHKKVLCLPKSVLRYGKKFVEVGQDKSLQGVKQKNVESNADVQPSPLSMAIVEMGKRSNGEVKAPAVKQTPPATSKTRSKKRTNTKD